jgi:hypothetical protein
VQPVPYEPFDYPPPGADVGAFDQGSPVSRWALARYLVGRAVGESISRSLLIVAVLLLGLTAAAAWGLHSTFLAVVVFLVALGVLTLRALMRAVLRRLTAIDQVGPLDQRLRTLVADTRADVLRELRRIGLPSHTATLPLFAVRLGSRRRRGETLTRLRTFDVDRVVTRARLDELHLLLQSITGRPRGPVA